MLHAIAALDAVRECCQTEQPLPPELGDWLAGSIEKFLTKECDDLNESFGIVQAHGGVPWWLERGIRQRDEALRELARLYFPGLTVSAQAAHIRRLAQRYEGTAWPRDARSGDMPRRYSGTPQAYLWEAFKSGARMPVSERHLRTLLQPTGTDPGPSRAATSARGPGSFNKEETPNEGEGK